MTAFLIFGGSIALVLLGVVAWLVWCIWAADTGD